MPVFIPYEEYPQLELLEFENMKMTKQKIFNYIHICKNLSITKGNKVKRKLAYKAFIIAFIFERVL